MAKEHVCMHYIETDQFAQWRVRSRRYIAGSSCLYFSSIRSVLLFKSLPILSGWFRFLCISCCKHLWVPKISDGVDIHRTSYQSAFRVQNRLFQSRHPAAIVHPIPPFHRNEHFIPPSHRYCSSYPTIPPQWTFHPDPAWLNASCSSSPPMDKLKPLQHW